jgi:hypothetical protein
LPPRGPEVSFRPLESSGSLFRSDPLKDPNMSNYAIWNVRLRHEALAKPRKGKHLSRRKRARIGLQDAIDRKSNTPAGTPAEG